MDYIQALKALRGHFREKQHLIDFVDALPVCSHFQSKAHLDL